MDADGKNKFVYTVKPVLRDHCHERPPVLKDQYSWQKVRATFQCN